MSGQSHPPCAQHGEVAVAVALAKETDGGAAGEARRLRRRPSTTPLRDAVPLPIAAQQGGSRANTARGEAMVAGFVLRPSFAALCAAEDELGPLFALVERAAGGALRLAEMVALFWHCLTESNVEREAFSDAVTAGGLAAATPALKILLGQILGGR